MDIVNLFKKIKKQHNLCLQWHALCYTILVIPWKAV